MKIWEEKKGWKQFSPQNKLVQDSDRNEENRYPDPDSKKTKKTYAMDPNKDHKNNLKDEIM
jgi:hypothetical protein